MEFGKKIRKNGMKKMNKNIKRAKLNEEHVFPEKQYMEMKVKRYRVVPIDKIIWSSQMF